MTNHLPLSLFIFSLLSFISNHRSLSKPLIKSSINNFHSYDVTWCAPSLSHACSSIDPSRRTRYSRTLDSEREREKRERVPRPILDRNEANGRRIAGPGFRAGNFSYARFRGKNKTGCRKRNEGTNERRSPVGQAISPCTGDMHYPPDMVKAERFKEKRGRKAESQKTRRTGLVTLWSGNLDI